MGSTLMAMLPRHRLVTLGTPALMRLTLAGAWETLLSPSKPLALVTYLALAPSRSASRDHLVDLLWADTDPDRARQTLRQTLWQLRRILGEDAIANAGDAVRLDLPLEVDRDAFLQAIQDRESVTAVSLYTGPFLPVFAAPGCAAFEHWADLERSRLQAVFRQALEEVTRHYLAERDWIAAQRYARLLRDAEPDSEESWRLLLESLLGGGDLREALVQVDALEKMLREEERNSELATRELISAIQEGGSSRSDRASHVLTSFVGSHTAPDAMKRQRTPAVAYVTLTIIVMSALTAAAYWTTARSDPERLGVVETPLSMQAGLAPTPVIEIEDRSGRRVVGAHDTVQVEIGLGAGRLRGTTVVEADSGVARFPDLQVDSASAQVSLRFRSGRLLPATVAIPNVATTLPTLQLIQAKLNGQFLAADSALLTIRPTDSIRGTVTLRYSSYWGAAAVMLGATPTWGDKRTSFVTLAPLATPAVGRGLSVPITLPGPERRGNYSIIIFFAAEPDVRWIASGTNWTAGHPIWDDGNDIADWTTEQLVAARRRGVVATEIVRRRQRMPTFVPAAVIDVVVR